MRESPTVALMEILRTKGVDIAYSDPHVPVFPKIRKHYFNLESVTLAPKTLASYDLVLLAINHDAFDYKMIKQHAKLIVDTRGVYLEPALNVVKT